NMPFGVASGASFGVFALSEIGHVGAASWFGVGANPPSDADFVGAYIDASVPRMALQAPRGGGNVANAFSGIDYSTAMSLGFATAPTTVLFSTDVSFSQEQAQIDIDASTLYVFGSNSGVRMSSHVFRVWYIGRTMTRAELEQQTQTN